MSFLVLTEYQALLLDAGTGVSRLLEPPVARLTARYENLDILLSHYHLDHVVGLSYLPAVWPRGQVRIYGPSAPLVESTPESALGRLLEPPLFPVKTENFPAKVEVIPVREPEISIGKLRVQVWSQPHPGGSVGMRLGDELAYLTDTSVEQAHIEKIRGVRLLLHELWLTDAEAAVENKPGHSSLTPVANLAKAAGVGRIMLVHHHPKRTSEQLQTMADEGERLAGIPASPGNEGHAEPAGDAPASE